MKFKCGHNSLVGVGNLCMACHIAMEAEKTKAKPKHRKEYRERGRPADRSYAFVENRRKALASIVTELERIGYTSPSFYKSIQGRLKMRGIGINRDALMRDMREIGWQVVGGKLQRR